MPDQLLFEYITGRQAEIEAHRGHHCTDNGEGERDRKYSVVVEDWVAGNEVHERAKEPKGLRQ